MERIRVLVTIMAESSRFRWTCAMYVSLKNLPCSIAERFSGMKGRYEHRRRTEIFQPELSERLVFVERLHKVGTVQHHWHMRNRERPTSRTPFEPGNLGYRARSSPSASNTVVVFLIPSETLEAKSNTPATGFAMAL